MTKSTGKAADPAWRKARARNAALARHAQGGDTAAAARAKSPASLAYWLQKVDPRRELDPAERERRALLRRKGYYASLQLKAQGARVRRDR